MGLIYFTIYDKITNPISSLYFCALVRLLKIHILVFHYSLKNIIHEIFIRNGRPSPILNNSILLNKSYLPPFLSCSEQTGRHQLLEENTAQFMQLKSNNDQSGLLIHQWHVINQQPVNYIFRLCISSTADKWKYKVHASY